MGVCEGLLVEDVARLVRAAHGGRSLDLGDAGRASRRSSTGAASTAAGTYMFADVERLSAEDTVKAEPAVEGARLGGGGRRAWSNHPGRSMRRYELLRTLYERGINRFNVYRLTEARWPERYPVFLRVENDHAGPRSAHRCARGTSLRPPSRRSTQERPVARDMIVTEFCDTADERGIYRKYGRVRHRRPDLSEAPGVQPLLGEPGARSDRAGHAGRGAGVRGAEPSRGRIAHDLPSSLGSSTGRSTMESSTGSRRCGRSRPTRRSTRRRRNGTPRDGRCSSASTSEWARRWAAHGGLMPRRRRSLRPGERAGSGGTSAERRRAGKAVVLVAGKDPLVSIGGHGTYVRAHARALRGAGFEPHIFSVHGRVTTCRPTSGCIHRARSPLWPDRPWMVPAHAGPIARRIERWVRE